MFYWFWSFEWIKEKILFNLILNRNYYFLVKGLVFKNLLLYVGYWFLFVILFVKLKIKFIGRIWGIILNLIRKGIIS